MEAVNTRLVTLEAWEEIHTIIYIYEELKKIGFKYICTFENMKPVFHTL